MFTQRPWNILDGEWVRLKQAGLLYHLIWQDPFVFLLGPSLAVPFQGTQDDAASLSDVTPDLCGVGNRTGCTMVPDREVRWFEG